MDDSLAAHTAGLYRVDADLGVHKVMGDIGISNFFVWSRENDRSSSRTRWTSRLPFDYDHDEREDQQPPQDLRYHN